MKIKDLVSKAKQAAGLRPDADLAIEVLLVHCLNYSKERLFLSLEEYLKEGKEKEFTSLFNRYLEGEPVAQLVNNKEFYGLDFVVDKRVLTPRPETELLVEKVIAFCSGRGIQRILDVGTGSGCIAIALAINLPDALVTGSEISDEALEVANINAEKHGVSNKITFRHSDLLEDIHGEFDVVVANLPYIGTEKYNFVSLEAKKFEPHVALFGGINGLVLYERFFAELREKNWKPKLLLGEFGFLQGDDMRSLINKYFNGEKVFFIKDYASIERVFMVYFE